VKTIVCVCLLASSLVAASLSACSSDSTDDEPDDTSSPDGSTTQNDSGTTPKNDAAAPVTDTGTKDTGPGGACNTLTNTATEANQSTVKGNAPAATGGTIADGTYFLSEFVLYDPTGTDEAPSPSGLNVTMSIKGTAMDSIQTLPDSTSQTFAETFVTNGTKLQRTLSCPKAGPDLEAVYTVAGNKLTIFETDPNSKLVAGNVYTKQ
jgi:hypothetical protein